MTFRNAVLLFFVGVVGGGINAVAGGGSFLAFPALLFTGVPPVPANASNTFAMWVGTAGTTGAYRRHLNLSQRVMIPLIVTALAGGLIGALLLIHTPARTFLRVLPWLVLAATLLFAFGKHLTGYMAGAITGNVSNAAIVSATIFELLVAIYGGYFGAGIGIMNLAMFAALGMADINAMNALKVLLSTVTNASATVTFVAAGAIVWPQALVMSAGAVIGGYLTAHYAQKVPQAWIRALVIAIGVTMTIYFFVRYYV